MQEKELIKKMEKLITESGCSYGTAMNTLSYLLAEYRDKGNNLLNSTNVQEVAKVSRLPQVRN